VEDHPTARHPGEVAEQANPAILKPPIFPPPLSETSPRNEGRRVAGVMRGGLAWMLGVVRTR
jgi:hypothetical protein